MSFKTFNAFSRGKEPLVSTLIFAVLWDMTYVIRLFSGM